MKSQKQTRSSFQRNTKSNRDLFFATLIQKPRFISRNTNSNRNSFFATLIQKPRFAHDDDWMTMGPHASARRYNNIYYVLLKRAQ